MITRRNFLVGFLALVASSYCNKIYPLVLFDQSLFDQSLFDQSLFDQDLFDQALFGKDIEMRAGWIMMKEDK